MSGHSHWASIKHKKGAADEKRGKVFSKLARLISVAAKEKGGDPESNPKLRLAIEQAKSVNMPKDNIERAIKKGTGELEGEKLEEITFEAFGPGGIAIIIEGITDNKKRALEEVRQTLNRHQGKLAGEGSVKWLFERKGVIIINIKNQISNAKNEELELKAIEAGAEDINWTNDFLQIIAKPEDLEKIKKTLEENGLKTESASLDWVAKETIAKDEKDKEASQKLFEALDESDSVQDIYSNLEI